MRSKCTEINRVCSLCGTKRRNAHVKFQHNLLLSCRHAAGRQSIFFFKFFCVKISSFSLCNRFLLLAFWFAVTLFLFFIFLFHAAFIFWHFALLITQTHFFALSKGFRWRSKNWIHIFFSRSFRYSCSTQSWPSKCALHSSSQSVKFFVSYFQWIFFSVFGTFHVTATRYAAYTLF